MNRVGVVAVALEMALHNGFHSTPFQVRAREGATIEQHFLDVLGESIAIPDAEVIELVAAKEEPFEVKRRKHMIDLRYPLGHTMVVGVFSLKRELEQPARDL